MIEVDAEKMKQALFKIIEKNGGIFYFDGDFLSLRQVKPEQKKYFEEVTPKPTTPHLAERTTAKPMAIYLNAHEIQSGSTRVDFAEGLIEQLDVSHDGRNTWLMNYGKREQAVAFRALRDITFDQDTQSACLVGRGQQKDPFLTPIPHLAERKLWLAQREAGTNEVWQSKSLGGWEDVPAYKEPGWYEDNEYRVKPKTMKKYMAMFKLLNSSDVWAISHADKAEIINIGKANGWVMVGDIVEREVEL